MRVWEHQPKAAFGSGSVIPSKRSLRSEGSGRAARMRRVLCDARIARLARFHIKLSHYRAFAEESLAYPLSRYAGGGDPDENCFTVLRTGSQAYTGVGS